MTEYRKDVTHKPDSEYAWVELGPIPGLPEWHQQSQPSRYPFPTGVAAVKFATNNKAEWPERTIHVVFLDGHREEIEA